MNTPGELAAAGGELVRPRRPRFVAFHKSDRNFFLVFVLVCWLGVIMGFAHPVMDRINGHPRFTAPLILKIHATAFVSWLVLLTTQVLLVRSRRTALHMKLGIVGVALVPVMAVSAYFSEIYTQRWHLTQGKDNFAFFIVPVLDVLGFTILAITALALRKNPSAHKRLILLATTIIVGAAYSRWWGDGLAAAYGDGIGGMLVNTYAGADLILGGALGYDFWTRGRLHRVYEIVVPAILLSQLTATLIYHSAAWLPIARYVIRR
jgi:uncharacterized membrane protein